MSGYINDPRKNIHSLYYKEMIINPFLSTKNIPTTGLIATWKLDEGSGNIINESVSNLLTTSPYNVGWIPGINGTAIFTTYGGSYFRVENAEITKLYNGSVSVWAKTSNNSTGYRGIVVKQNAYSIFLINNNVGLFNWQQMSSSVSQISISDDIWHHIVLTFSSGILSGTKIYVDGELALTTTMTIQAQDVGIAVGEGSSIGEGQNFGGDIDEIKLYNRVLTSDEVLLLFHEFD